MGWETKSWFPQQWSPLWCVHHPARGPSPDARVGLDHLPRVGQVPEGVDDEPAGAVHEAGVAGAEAAVGLEAGVDVAGDLTELHVPPDNTGRRGLTIAHALG